MEPVPHHPVRIPPDRVERRDQRQVVAPLVPGHLVERQDELMR